MKLLPQDQELVGLTEEQAKEKSPKLHVSVRDGKAFAKTLIYAPDRVNVIVENNIVTKVLSRG